MTTPAEDHAERLGLSVVALPTFDLLRAASGHPMIVSALDGQEVLIRLATPAEIRQAQADARASLPENARPPLMSRAQAAELVKPTPF